MYTCEICKRVVPAKTKANRIVVETRFRRYPFRAKVNKLPNNQYRDDQGGVGFEIAREVVACHDCAVQFRGSS